MEEIKIDDRIVQEKAKEIGKIIENLTLPYVFSILGFVIVEVVISAMRHGFNIETLASMWLDRLSKHVKTIPDDVEAETRMYNNTVN